MWFVEASEDLIIKRMLKRLPKKEIDPNRYLKIDANCPELKNKSDITIKNIGSLNLLRQKIDNFLFQFLKFNIK
jgi:dephospho-CoA kinase